MNTTIHTPDVITVKLCTLRPGDAFAVSLDDDSDHKVYVPLHPRGKPKLLGLTLVMNLETAVETTFDRETFVIPLRCLGFAPVGAKS